MGLDLITFLLFYLIECFDCIALLCCLVGGLVVGSFDPSETSKSDMDLDSEFVNCTKSWPNQR